MKSEAINKEALPNLQEDVEKAQASLIERIESLKLSSAFLKGFIQEIQLKPFGYILLSKVQVKLDSFSLVFLSILFETLLSNTFSFQFTFF